jgi:hypothetical protein
MKTKAEAERWLRKQGYERKVPHRGRMFWQKSTNDRRDLAEIKQTTKGWDVVLPYALAGFFYVTTTATKRKTNA